MITGYMSPSLAEDLMRKTHLQIIISRREMLDATWRHDICSPFWRLYINNRSGGYLDVNGKRLHLAGGAIWLVPAWVRFQTGLTGSVRQDFIHFQVTGLPPALLRRFFDRPVQLVSDPALRRLCRHWQKGLATTADIAHLFWANALVQAALATMLSGATRTDQTNCFRWMSDSGELQPALQRIESSMDLPPANFELARLCGLSEDHFINKFRRVLGITPAQYGRERRLAVAAEWLVTSERSIDEIAEAFGFTDRFHFSRAFAARFDLPPAAYRRLHG